jgi:hypothetical protein
MERVRGFISDKTDSRLRRNYLLGTFQLKELWFF